MLVEKCAGSGCQRASWASGLKQSRVDSLTFTLHSEIVIYLAEEYDILPGSWVVLVRTRCGLGGGLMGAIF